MKKFIKDWWPLLLIAGWWLLNRKQRSGKYYAGSNNPIPPEPSQQRVIKDYIRQLEKHGYTRSDEACPICGSVLYERKYVVDPGVPIYTCAKSAADWQQIERPYSVTETACTNPSCEKFDHRFVLYY